MDDIYHDNRSRWNALASANVPYSQPFLDYTPAQAADYVYRHGVLKDVKGKKVLCFLGSEENDSLCRRLDSTLAKPIILQGGHHFGGDYEGISQIILDELPKSRR